MSSARRRVAVLLSLCAALRGEIGRSGEPRQIRFSPPVGWGEVVELAIELGVSQALWEPIRHLDGVPAPIRERIRDQYQGNVIRNIRLRHQLVTVAEALNAAEIVPLLLKGAVQLADGTGAFGRRWMADLDIAIPSAEVEDTIATLSTIGYRRAGGKPFDHIHEIPLICARAPGMVDVHMALSSAALVREVLPLEEILRDSSELSLLGARARVPSGTHQVLHNVLHCAVQDLNHAVRGLPLRQLLALKQLDDLSRPQIDWEAAFGHMRAHGLGRVLRDHLWLAHKLFGMELPSCVSGEETRARIHEAQVLLGFGLVWPPELQRNVRLAFGRAYLDWHYDHGDRPLKLALARVRHASVVLRRDREAVVGKVLRRRI